MPLPLQSEFEELMKLIEAGDIAKIKPLIESCPELLTSKMTRAGRTTLFNNKLALPHDEDVYKFCDKTPLYVAVESICVAVKSKQIKLINLFLEVNPRLLDVVELSDWSSIHLAAKKGYVEIVELLLQINPKLIEAVSGYGQTLRDAAIECGHINIVKLLLKVKPELLDSVHSQGKTALHYAALFGHYEVALFLIKHKPGLIDAVDIEKNTPLHKAASWCGIVETIKLLFYANPKLIYVINKSRESAWDLAVKWVNSAAIESFINFEPKLVNCMANVCGEAFTVLQIAVELNQDTLISFLQKKVSVDQALQDLSKADENTKYLENFEHAIVYDSLELLNYLSEKTTALICQYIVSQPLDAIRSILYGQKVEDSNKPATFQEARNGGSISLITFCKQKFSIYQALDELAKFHKETKHLENFEHLIIRDSTELLKHLPQDNAVLICQYILTHSVDVIRSIMDRALMEDKTIKVFCASSFGSSCGSSNALSSNISGAPVKIEVVPAEEEPQTPLAELPAIGLPAIDSNYNPTEPSVTVHIAGQVAGQSTGETTGENDMEYYPPSVDF